MYVNVVLPYITKLCDRARDTDIQTYRATDKTECSLSPRGDGDLIEWWCSGSPLLQNAPH